MFKLELMRSLEVEEFLLTRMAFSPDGAWLAMGHKRFRTIEIESGRTLREFAYPEFLARLRFSPCGRFLAAANVADNHPATRGNFSLFDAVSSELCLEVKPALPVETFAFADAGRQEVVWNEPRPTLNGDEPCVAGGIGRASLDPPALRESLSLAGFELRALASCGGGFTGLVRESGGAALTVDNANLIFRKFRLLGLSAAGEVLHNFDLGIGAGVCALSPDGRLLAVELVDFKNNERHVSVIDAETGVEANLLPLEANTLPVFEFSDESDYFLCLKEDAEGDFNILRIWRTSDLKLVGEARLDLGYHAMASCLAHSTVAFLGGGKLDFHAIE